MRKGDGFSLTISIHPHSKVESTLAHIFHLEASLNEIRESLSIVSHYQHIIDMYMNKAAPFRVIRDEEARIRLRGNEAYGRKVLFNHVVPTSGRLL